MKSILSVGLMRGWIKYKCPHLKPAGNAKNCEDCASEGFEGSNYQLASLLTAHLLLYGNSTMSD